MMNNTLPENGLNTVPPHPVPKRKFNRRLFLKLAAATGVSAALGDALLTSAPWLDYDGQVRRTWDTPFRKEATLPAEIREMVRYATLAPSGHNAQPWKFAVQEDTIHILPDYARCLPAVDPQNRELWISLGCALENLVLAAQAAGYWADIASPVPGVDQITLHLSRSSAHGPTALMDAIPHRQNTLSLYDGRSASLTERKQMEAVKSDADVTTRMSPRGFSQMQATKRRSSNISKRATDASSAIRPSSKNSSPGFGSISPKRFIAWMDCTRAVPATPTSR